MSMLIKYKKNYEIYIIVMSIRIDDIIWSIQSPIGSIKKYIYDLFQLFLLG